MTEAALQKVRAFVRDGIAYATCCVNGEWVRAEISSAEILESAYVSIGFQIPPGESAQVTGVRLYDSADALWLEQDVNIAREAHDESLYFSARIKVYAE